jgi:hypothetical protein
MQTNDNHGDWWSVSGGHSDLIFYYKNKCSYPVWLAARPSIGDSDPERDPDTLEIFSMPNQWTGSIWARTKCCFNASYYFSCETGDCGSGLKECQNPPPALPVTLLNFEIKPSFVSYEVSLNHGHNIPVRIQPDGGFSTRWGWAMSCHRLYRSYKWRVSESSSSPEQWWAVCWVL